MSTLCVIALVALKLLDLVITEVNLGIICRLGAEDNAFSFHVLRNLGTIDWLCPGVGAGRQTAPPGAPALGQLTHCISLG